MPQAAIFFDHDLRAEANAAKRNYWHVYTREICRQMGLPFAEVPRSRLNLAGLASYRVLILPDLEPGYLRIEEKQALRQWVESGGLLIGFATGGLHALFGIKLKETLAQPQDAFTPVAAARCGEEVLSPIISPVKLIGQAEGQELARLADLFGRDLQRPAITLRPVGKGQALYFSFNVAQTVWAMHHGRPVLEDYDGDGRLSLRDAAVLRPFAPLLYADRLVGLLRNAIARRGPAFVHTLPPTTEGRVPEAAETVALTGCEALAIGNAPFVRRQVEEQVQRLGQVPACAGFEGAAWCGWTEPAEWLADAGVLAEGARAGLYPQFGTAYPFRYYRDWHKDNDPTRCLALTAGLTGLADASRLAQWWLARESAALEQDERGFCVDCDWETGCVVRLHWEGEVPDVGVMREEDGVRWLYVAVPRGRHQVKLKL